jgi:hypothetical protein
MHLKIKLPETGECLIKVGDSVDFSTPFVLVNKAVEVQIPIAQKLGIKPDKIFRHLKKFVGEKLAKGDVIAAKKSLFSTQKIHAPSEGLIKEIDHEKGVLVVEISSDEKNNINCYFKGHVHEIVDGTVTIKVSKGIEVPLKKTEANFGGAVFYFKTPEIADKVSAEDISDRVVIAEELGDFHQTKMEAMGGRGFVTLINLNDKSSVPHAMIKQIEDMKKIFEHEYPYCLIDSEYSKIYFYS